MKIRNLLCLSFFLMLFACSSNPTDNSKNGEKRQYVEQENPVDIMVLTSTVFTKQLVNNGKLVALKKSDLEFPNSAQIHRINVKNGDYVRKGDTIASLDLFSFQQDYLDAKLELESDELELRTELISKGYSIKDSSKIPPDIYRIAYIQSGYAKAKEEVVTKAFDLKNATLIAPFNGVVANITQKVYDQLSTEDAFCTLIDDSKFEVDFKVMEGEINEIHLGDKVDVNPFSSEDLDYEGTVIEINPVVDENGLIEVKALVQNDGHLLEGMNVRVIANEKEDNQLVVPKSAVILRQNKEVLFKYTHGKAFWTYVKTLAENGSSYAVVGDKERESTLAAGDTVIISGNLNLAHESKVKIEN